MDGISAAASLIAVLQIASAVISICYDYRQGHKHASREVIQLSDELNSLKDVLDALLRLAEKSESSDPARLSMFELLAKPDGPLLTCQSELEKLKAKLEPETGWRAVRRSLVWPLQEGEMRKALGSLERLKSTMQLALSADQATLSMAIRDDVEDLARLFQRHSDDQRYTDIFRWLAAPDPHANHVASRKKRQPKSGDWFLSSKQYEGWIHRAGSFLWLYGIPGSGKTILCSTIIDRIVSYRQEMPKTVVAYFYFDFNDIGKRNLAALVRSLITQLVSQSHSIPRPLLDLYDSHQNGKKSVDDEDLVIALRNIILTFHNVYIIFDALDESSGYEEVLGFIKTTQEWELSRLHLLTTSRQLPLIEEAFEGLVSERICLQEAHMNKDITVYIADKLANDKTLTRWPLEVRKQIKETLIAEEDGMFRWVVCQLDMLKRCMSVAAVKKALTSLPKNLDETYDRILLEIDDFHQVEVMKTMQALIVSVEPLTLEEIVEVLAMDLDVIPPRFDPDSRLLDPRSVLFMCSSLVTVGPEYRHFDGFIHINWTPVDTLRLAHASVADYLTQSRPSGPSKFHFTKHSARQFFARACLAYLMNPRFVNGHERGKMKLVLKEFPFLSHAVRFWPTYLEKESDDPEDHIESSTKELLQAFFATSKLRKGGNFAFWVGMLIPTSSDSYIQTTHPLYYAASYGLTEVVRIILDTERDINIDQLGGRAHSSALHVAVYRNHPDVVKLLLERGADPNLANDKDESPLFWAVTDNGVANLLIQYGAGMPVWESNDPDVSVGSVERRAILLPEGGAICHRAVTCSAPLSRTSDHQQEEYEVIESSETLQPGQQFPNAGGMDVFKESSLEVTDSGDLVCRVEQAKQK